jgi:transposase-like protein
MKKQQLIDLLGNPSQIAKRLGIAHRNNVYAWPEELTDRQSDNVIVRMKAARIKVPPEWIIKV